jgi:hypothetical protein
MQLVVCFATHLTLLQIVSAINGEKEVPRYVLDWSRDLGNDALRTPNDNLDLLGAQLASVRAAYRTHSKTDEEMMDICNILEKDLLAWAETVQSSGSLYTFRQFQDHISPDAWNGIRHEYTYPQTYRYWNKWRSFRILVSRLQEALWRRSWPLLARPTQPIHDSEYYRSIRDAMARDICIGTASAIGSDSSQPPPEGSLAIGYSTISPLALAGMCFVEHLTEPLVTPGGNRLLWLDQPLHLDSFNESSAHLAWIVNRLDYLADTVGINWAAATSRLFSGGAKVYFDLGRS